jgi:hypothetical protein
MTTIDRFTRDFNFTNFGEVFREIEPANYRDYKTFTFVTPKFVLIPIAVFKNITALFKLLSFKKTIEKFSLEFQVAFLSASDEDKIELYATINHLTEILNDKFAEKKLSKVKGGFLTKTIHEEIGNLINFVNKNDKYFFKIAYPDSRDENDAEFINEVLEAHKNSSVKY